MTQSSAPDISGLRIDDAARGREGSGRRTWLVGAAAVVVIVVALVALVVDRRPEVSVATAQPSSHAGLGGAVLNASGYVTPRRRATVAAKITARVTEVLVEEGMEVATGQVLARLDDADALARLAAARASLEVARANVPVLEVNLANAERELLRAERLMREGVDSERAHDLARTTAEALKAQLAAAREEVKAAEAGVRVAAQDVENCTVRAPFSGVAVSKDAQVGEMVSPVSAGGGYTRTGISTIVDMTSLEIEVDVNESYIARVTPGQEVTATLDAYPEWQIPASVRTVIPTADRQKATVKVRITFSRLDPRILPDMGVKVAFLSGGDVGAGDSAARCVVPEGAVRDESGQPVVYVFADGVLERRAVGVGRVRAGETEILAGISPGEQVVVAGEGLGDGKRVRIKP
jgi:RND family efflux transporter MFP subunit